MRDLDNTKYFYTSFPIVYLVVKLARVNAVLILQLGAVHKRRPRKIAKNLPLHLARKMSALV